MTRAQPAQLQNLFEDRKILPASQLSLIRKVASFASEHGLPIYLVGGFVRDLLLGHPTLDHDFVVEGDAILFARSLGKKFGGRATVHPAFHTATWFLPDGFGVQPSALDLISARSEKYARPAALPTVTLGSLADDLRRRDFTINAMAVRLDDDHFGELSDPFGGQSDLKNGLVRVLHPRSFIDDPTRIFRAIRYAGRYGFKIESETLASIPAALKYVDELSGERLRHELDLILAEENSPGMLAHLAGLHLLTAVRPVLPDFPVQYTGLVGRVPSPRLGLDLGRADLGYLLWFMDTPEDEVAAISKRLDFTANLAKAVHSAAHLRFTLPSLSGLKPSQWTERLDRSAPSAVYAVSLVARETALETYLQDWRHVKPLVTGEDLKARGLTPGPRFKHILASLRAAWLDGAIKTPRDEQVYLDRLLQGQDSE